jgi:crotonobetainyl-CoA:carnitine CoA-transferase CaiB-like acyl-CoA transferase
MFSSHQFIRCLSSQTWGVLSGIRILDMTRILAGPFCSMLLGDLGAEVIKIEKPNSGDETRVWGPPFVSSQMSCYFVAVNRNKKALNYSFKLIYHNFMITSID